MSDENDIYCSFCGKSALNVVKMVRGPGNVAICSECILTALHAILDPAASKKEEGE